MKTYPGVGARIRERLLALDYRRPDGEPDVTRFSFDFRIEKALMYGWLRETMTPTKDLARLCDALCCSIDWLLRGEEYVPKKAAPRLGRGRIKSLLLGLVAASAALLSPSVALAGETPSDGPGALHPPSYRKRTRFGMVTA